MLETLRQTIIVDFSIFINSLIYFLKRIPLVKSLFKKVGYEHAGISKVLYVFGLIYSAIRQLFKSSLLLFCSFGIPYLLLKERSNEVSWNSLYWHIFFIFYFIQVLINGKILEPHRRKFIAVKLLRMNAKRFVLADYFPALIQRQIIECLLFYFVAKQYSVDLVLVLFMLIAKNLFSVFVEMLHIRFFEKTGSFIHNKMALNIIYVLIVLFLGYFTTINHLIINIPYQIVFFLGILCWLIGLLSVNYILKYKNYSSAINEANRLDKLSVDVKSTKKNAEFSRVKFKDKEFSKEELQYDITNKKEGFAYINEIFFKRHKRILLGPIKLQGIIIMVATTLCIIISLLVPGFSAQYEGAIIKVFPVFIYILYIISTGQKATKAMFYNCDISLLHYGFYKTKEAVLATFTLRAKHLILENLMPAGLMALGILIIDVFAGGTVTKLIPIAIMILVLSVFFVIHNLFLYYIFQPYTTDLNVKNPLYKILNVVTYFLCYISLQLEDMSYAFLMGVVLITFIYSIVALIVVYRIAPKTFVIK